jgi:hypothetical protein
MRAPIFVSDLRLSRQTHGFHAQSSAQAELSILDVTTNLVKAAIAGALIIFFVIFSAGAGRRKLQSATQLFICNALTSRAYNPDQFFLWRKR